NNYAKTPFSNRSNSKVTTGEVNNVSDIEAIAKCVLLYNLAGGNLMKKLIAGIILSCLIIVGCTFFIFYDKPTKTSTMQTTVTTVALEDMTEESRTKNVETTETSQVEEDKVVKDEVQKLETKGNHKFVKTVILDVPSENRLEDEPLENGGAVTAASMLLQYYLIPTNKNELAS